MSADRASGLKAAGFFVLRTPLLPFDDFESWGRDLAVPQVLRAMPADDPDRRAALAVAIEADQAALRERLRAIVQRDEVREALFVGSPDLDDSVDVWLRDPESERGQRIERALVRYVSRMTGRATPFGLFAGCSVGRIGDDARIELAPRSEYRRHTRLDMDYLSLLSSTLGRESPLRAALRYSPNDSLHATAGRLHYVESVMVGRMRRYSLVAIDDSPYLRATLEQARGGATPGALAAALVDDEITREDALAFIDELIDGQVIVSDLEPAVTGPEPIHALIDRLRDCNTSADAVDALVMAREHLGAIDARALGVSPQSYRAVASRLESLPAPVEASRLFQVDMSKPVRVATLDRTVVAELERAATVLIALNGRNDDDELRRFRAAFVERYEAREMPLTEVLDDEVGIGFGGRGDAATRDAEAQASARRSGRDAWLTRRLLDMMRRGARELVLDDRDVAALGNGAEPAPFPDAFALTSTVVAADAAALARGEFEVVMGAVSGPSGAIMLGRFCHGDEELTECVAEHLRAEEAARPEAIFAEVVHLPEGRIGNILLRPLLRDYEITYLGRSGVDEQHRITVDDLLVSIVDGRIVLRSRRLDREIVPRLTSAHGYFIQRNLAAYRFICALQRQDGGAYGWHWGALAGLPSLPRVRSGRAVLARAAWNVEHAEIKRITSASGAAERFAAADAWRREREIPRYAAVTDADNLLPVDFDNVLSVETFLELIKKRQGVILTEMYPGPDALCVSGPEGRFVHELVVPFAHRNGAEARPRKTTPGAERSATVARSFAPGSEWLYAKLYGGGAVADQVLGRVLRPLVDAATKSGAADRWFFLRYADPEPHLRVRLHGDPTALVRNVLPLLHELAAPLLSERLLWRVQLDTYEREVERYGGAAGIELAERFFHADSEAVLSIVEELAGDEGVAARWTLAFRSIDALLTDFDLELADRQRLFGDGGRASAAGGMSLRKMLSDRFRAERPKIERAMSETPEPILASSISAIARRSAALAGVAAELRANEASGALPRTVRELLPSFTHMHINRLLRTEQRSQEMVINHFLSRWYESVLARSRKAAG